MLSSLALRQRLTTLTSRKSGFVLPSVKSTSSACRFTVPRIESSVAGEDARSKPLGLISMFCKRLIGIFSSVRLASEDATASPAKVSWKSKGKLCEFHGRSNRQHDVDTSKSLSVPVRPRNSGKSSFQILLSFLGSPAMFLCTFSVHAFRPRLPKSHPNRGTSFLGMLGSKVDAQPPRTRGKSFSGFGQQDCEALTTTFFSDSCIDLRCHRLDFLLSP